MPIEHMILQSLSVLGSLFYSCLMLRYIVVQDIHECVEFKDHQLCELGHTTVTFLGPWDSRIMPHLNCLDE